MKNLRVSVHRNGSSNRCAYVSTSWVRSIAETFADDEGMIFEITKEFREEAICCDVSWISKFPHEYEINSTEYFGCIE